MQNNKRRKTLGMLAVGAALAAAGVPAFAEPAYPNRLIKIICAFPAGNSADVAARVLAQQLAAKWGQSVVVENHPGASGMIAAGIVKSAKPDGYTLLMTSTSVAINSAVMKDMNYDLASDFAPLNMINSISAVLLVANESPISSVAELIRMAKAEPNKYSYGEVGIGTIQNMSAKLFMQRTGTALTEIGYKGSVEAVTDIIGGRLNMMFEADNSAYTLVNTGKVKALASTGPHRFFGLPNVPTMKELGIDVDVVGFTTLLAPSATPQGVVDKINQDVNQALASPALIDGMRKIGLDIFTPLMNAQQTRKWLLDDRSQWEEVARRANIVKQ